MHLDDWKQQNKRQLPFMNFAENVIFLSLFMAIRLTVLPKEKMSIYAYIDWEKPKLNDGTTLMGIESISNNRDGMALRILADKLAKAPQTTKLLFSISDGQPRAMPDYSGKTAIDDMKQVIHEYSRKGIYFLAAAIGKIKK